MMKHAEMVILLVSSVASFLAMFFALLTVLRRIMTLRTPAAAAFRPAHNLPNDSFLSASNPLLPAKRPDWRFLVRGRKRSRAAALRSILRASVTPTTPSENPGANGLQEGMLRSDWAHFHEDLGDLGGIMNPQPESLPLARRA